MPLLNGTIELKNKGREELIVMAKQDAVITSYSIHYTKLYEEKGGMKMARLMYPKRDSYCVNRSTVRESLPFTELYENGMIRCTAGKRGSEVNTWSMCYQITSYNFV